MPREMFLGVVAPSTSRGDLGQQRGVGGGIPRARARRELEALVHHVGILSVDGAPL
jgi:hypothetical protein